MIRKSLFVVINVMKNNKLKLKIFKNSLIKINCSILRPQQKQDLM